MLRMLWKEWHELKWYVLGLIAAPLLIGLMPRVSFGYRSGRIEVWDVQVLMILLALWGGTRIATEMQSNKLTTRSLPIEPWRLLAAKFLPGFIAAMLLPTYLYLIAMFRYPDVWAQTFHQGWPEQLHAYVSIWLKLAGSNAPDHPLTCLVRTFWFSVSIYTASFALSLLMSGIGAAMLSWLVVFMAAALATSGLQGSWSDEWFRITVTLASLFLTIGVWVSARNAQPRRKWSVAVRWSALGLISTIFASLMIAAIVTGDLRYTLMVACDKVGLGGNRIRYILPYPRYVLTPDRETIAYSEDRSDYKPHQIKSRNGKHTYSLSDMQTQEALLVRSRDEAFEIALADRVSPVAWTPQGSLLFVKDIGWRMDLQEWNPESREMRTLAEFQYTGKNRVTSIRSVIPDSDCRRLALFVTPHRGSGLDLWVLDRSNGTLKMIRPGLDANSWNGVMGAWNGDMLVVQHWMGSNFRTIRADGSEYRELRPEQEAKSDD